MSSVMRWSRIRQAFKGVLLLCWKPVMIRFGFRPRYWNNWAVGECLELSVLNWDCVRGNQRQSWERRWFTGHPGWNMFALSCYRGQPTEQDVSDSEMGTGAKQFMLNNLLCFSQDFSKSLLCPVLLDQSELLVHWEGRLRVQFSSSLPLP